jgi:formyl-CoA transferase
VAEPAAALAGVRVLELGEGIAGPFAARLLADFGADVVKVERPGLGDVMRRRSPIEVDDERVRDALFAYLNWSKRSIELDLAVSEAADTLRGLVERADVVIAALRPGRLESWGLGIDQMRSWNPRLVVVSLSNFGQHGPCAGWDATDLTLQAMAGTMQVSGASDREPLKRGLRQAAYTAGMTAAYTAILGHIDALAVGTGAHVDVSMQECLASEGVLNQPYYAFLGAVQGRRPPVKDPLDGNPVPCADGYATLQTTSLVPMRRLAEVFDEPRLEAPEFASREARATNAVALGAVIDDNVGDRAGRELFEWASERNLLCGFVQDTASLLGCPQLHARGAFSEVPGAPTGWRTVAQLARLSATPQAGPGPVPGLGQHTDEVLAELGTAMPAAPDVPPRRAGGLRTPARERGPLSGLRVLDLSAVFAMPYLTALLGDMGAEVIKVEAPHRLDQTRVGWGAVFDNEPGDDPWNRSSTFQVLGRNKRSLAIDLATEAGRDVIWELVDRCDVVVEAFSPRVMAKWGMTYPELAARRPDVVMVSNSGYGGTGPWSRYRAQGTTLEATMGIQFLTGYSGGLPAKVGQSYPDFLACWSGLVALMAALLHRDRTGQGQWIDLGMYQLGAVVTPEALLHFQAHGRCLPRANEDLDAVFSAVVPAAGADRWLAVSAFDEDRLAALCRVIGVHPGAPGAAGRTARIRAGLATWAGSRERMDGAAELQDAGVPAGPVNDIRDLMLDPHLRERSLYEPIEVAHGVGCRRLLSRPYRWSAPSSALKVRSSSPDLGEGNDFVLRDLLALDPDRVAGLRSAGVVSDGPVNPPPLPRIDLDALLATGEMRTVDPEFRRIAGCSGAGSTTAPAEAAATVVSMPE